MPPKKKRHATYDKDWTTNEEYEIRARAKHKFGPPDYVLRTKNDKKGVNPALLGFNKNAEYWEKMDKGEIVELPCKTCEELMPFSSFHIDYKARRGRASTCRECKKKISKQRGTYAGGPNSKANKKHNPRTRLAILIKADMSMRFKKAGKRYDPIMFSTKNIWDKLEKHCGYNSDQFKKHMEKQFLPWMNWNNNGRPGSPKDLRWQYEHKKCRVDFEYLSFDDPQFIECWSLENLTAIQSIMNNIKSNKKLREQMVVSYRNGIKSKNLYQSSIWKFLTYTNLEARDYFFNHSLKIKEMGKTEKEFWNNYGKVWNIGHIIPQAKLAYESTECENFKECWSLANLKPQLVVDNSKVGSLYENKIWHHNNK